MMVKSQPRATLWTLTVGRFTYVKTATSSKWFKPSCPAQLDPHVNNCPSSESVNTCSTLYFWIILTEISAVDYGWRMKHNVHLSTDDEHWPIAIGQLSDSGDLKTY